MSTDDKKQDFHDGIFALRTRRFGKIAEIMIKRLYGFSYSRVQNYDLFDSQLNERIEVKFSTVQRACPRINELNAVSECIYATISHRVIASDMVSTCEFDCNIQQIKCREFDVLYYGLFFLDQIQIYRMTSQQVLNAPGYSNKQHRGNVGEGQFHINNETFVKHQAHLVRRLSYDELYDLLK